MDFTETACVCALLLRIRKDRRKKRHWVHPVVSKRLLNGQFYKLYKDLKETAEKKIVSYFRMSIESFDKLLVLVGPLHLYRPFFSAAKSEVVIPRRKFRFASFFEHFEAVPFFLLANCSLPLHHLECLNYYAFRDLQCEVKGIAVGRNIDIYDVFCCPHQLAHSSLKLTPS